MIDVEALKDHIFDVVGCIYEVHKKLGSGLNEYVYQEGLEIELCNKSINFSRELSFHPLYDGKEMKAVYRLDFLCKGDIIIESKSISELCDDNRAQLFNYLRLTNSKAGILVNFSPAYIQIERYFYDSVSRTLFNVNSEPIRNLPKGRYR